MAQLVKNLPAMQETWVQSLGWEDPLEKGKAYPLQYSGLENSMDSIVHAVAKSLTLLSDFHFHCLHTDAQKSWLSSIFQGKHSGSSMVHLKTLYSKTA